MIAAVPEWVDAERAKQHGLTQRHRQILAGIALGKTDIQIGRELHLSEHTIKSHLRVLLRLLGATSRTGAVGYSYDCGLLRTRAMRDELARLRVMAS